MLKRMLTVCVCQVVLNCQSHIQIHKIPVPRECISFCQRFKELQCLNWSELLLALLVLWKVQSEYNWHTFQDNLNLVTDDKSTHLRTG